MTIKRMLSFILVTMALAIPTAVSADPIPVKEFKKLPMETKTEMSMGYSHIFLGDTDITEYNRNGFIKVADASSSQFSVQYDPYYLQVDNYMWTVSEDSPYFSPEKYKAIPDAIDSEGKLHLRKNGRFYVNWYITGEASVELLNTINDVPVTYRESLQKYTYDQPFFTVCIDVNDEKLTLKKIDLEIIGGAIINYGTSRAVNLQGGSATIKVTTVPADYDFSKARWTVGLSKDSVTSEIVGNELRLTAIGPGYGDGSAGYVQIMCQDGLDQFNYVSSESITVYSGIREKTPGEIERENDPNWYQHQLDEINASEKADAKAHRNDPFSITGPTTITAGKAATAKVKVIKPDYMGTWVRWKSSNPKWLAVQGTGVGRSVKLVASPAGGGHTVTITAFADEYNYRKKSIKVKIKKVLIKKIKLSGKKSVKAGEEVQLKAKFTPSVGVNKSVKWTSSNKKWATVTKKGLVKTKKAGKGHTVIITAKAKDGSKKKATYKLKIK